MKKGFVYLVGAGPGDPGLFSLKGKEVLEKADVVIYDRLVSREILCLAHKDAQLMYVGKGPGHHTRSQDEINALLLKHARLGKTVVRLKGGDPFVFGRGAEEALYLRDNGCDFALVPGITSAVAAPAYAGIPVTHRTTASSVAVITGHETPSKKESALRWEHLATGVDTLVFLMGVTNLAFIVGKLLSHGMPARTPAALVRDATMPRQEVVAGTLNDIVLKAEKASCKPPGVFIVGDVVALREKLSWAEKLPLAGKKVVVTRPRHQAAVFMKQIRELGGLALELPVIEIVKERDLQHLHNAFERIDSFSWIVFSSVNAVDIFFEELFNRQLDARSLGGAQICAIGPETGKRLAGYGISSDALPSRYCAEGILELLDDQRLSAGQRVLLPRARGSREILPRGLQDRGVLVEEIYLYRAAPADRVPQDVHDAVLRGEVDIITFTSSSTVKQFGALMGDACIKQLNANVMVACIGPVTADTARNLGFLVDITGSRYTAEGLLEAIVARVK